MHTAGIIIEYDPMHRGHLYLLKQVRAELGPETAVIGVMSGNFVQRGDFALLREHARAEAAVRSGMDLVLELPLPWAVSSAERFADGGVQVLLGTGLVTDLAFGSECGDAAALMELTACLDSEIYHAGVRRFLDEGMPFAACRQAVARGILGGEKAALLEGPNNNLGVEYCKALLRRNSAVRPLAVRRAGMSHSGQGGGFAPATLLRRALAENGEDAWALSEMAPAMAEIYKREAAAGRAPVLLKNAERAMLARLRSMTKSDFAALDEGNEGLYNRLYAASRAAVSVDGVCQAAKTKRYAYARLRRMVLWAYLGLTPAGFPAEVPYLRVLAANETGRVLLARMRKSASIPILTKPGHVRRLDSAAQALFALEARAADLYALAYPDLTAAAGGIAWRDGPVLVMSGGPPERS